MMVDPVTKTGTKSKQLVQVHSIPLNVAEDSPGFIIPEKVGSLSQKDKSRLIYALGQNLVQQAQATQELDRIAGYLNHVLVMLTTPVSDQ